MPGEVHLVMEAVTPSLPPRPYCWMKKIVGMGTAMKRHRPSWRGKLAVQLPAKWIGRPGKDMGLLFLFIYFFAVLPLNSDTHIHTHAHTHTLMHAQVLLRLGVFQLLPEPCSWLWRVLPSGPLSLRSSVQSKGTLLVQAPWLLFGVAGVILEAES